MYVLLKSYEELDRENGFTKLGFVGDTDIYEMSKLLGKAHKAIYNKFNKTICGPIYERYKKIFKFKNFKAF